MVHSLVPDLADFEQPAAGADVGLLDLIGSAHHCRAHSARDAVVVGLAESTKRLMLFNVPRAGDQTGVL